MARHEVHLANKSFKSKTEAAAFFRDILNRYKDGQDIKPEDEGLLFKLIQRHPEADEKIGVGIDCFYRDRSPIHPSSCFHIERIDGTTTDFSFHACISGSAPTLYQLFYAACRFAVSKSLIHAKQRIFDEAGGTMTCAQSGAQITIGEADYRHTSPGFADIVNEFIAVNNITITPEMVKHGLDMQYVAKFANTEIEAKFREFHATKANLAMFKRM